MTILNFMWTKTQLPSASPPLSFLLPHLKKATETSHKKFSEGKQVHVGMEIWKPQKPAKLDGNDTPTLSHHPWRPAFFEHISRWNSKLLCHNCPTHLSHSHTLNGPPIISHKCPIPISPLCLTSHFMCVQFVHTVSIDVPASVGCPPLNTTSIPDDHFVSCSEMLHNQPCAGLYTL